MLTLDTNYKGHDLITCMPNKMDFLVKIEAPLSYIYCFYIFLLYIPSRTTIFNLKFHTNLYL